MEKNIKDYLHLYLGCRAKVIMAENSQSELPYYFSEDGIYKIEGVMLDFQSECESIKPILRPLSDMTDAEKGEARRMLKQNEIDIFFFDNTVKVAEYYQWLLSKNFDLFGLIEAGLAIDATKEAVK